MKHEQFKLMMSGIGILLLTVSMQVQASMLGLCNDAKYTQYICCPANGGWIVSNACDSGASANCVNDSGQIAGSDPAVTILQDCQNRGGSAMSYYLGAK